MLPDVFDGWPFWLIFTFLFFGGMARGQCIYWAARIVTERSLRRVRPRTGWGARVAEWLDGAGVDAGAQTIRRWGIAAIPLCYLTVGLQTLVMAAAGVLRINAGAFALAQVPGALAWAAIYSTIGWAVWEAALIAAAGSPWGLVALLGVAALLALLLWRRRRARRCEQPGAIGD
ncbi:DedA family protein [Gephyromycinifex aptenodytis]|uniref:DedA family protein n=1 Tax=Gephyromycinifex aptenodytis TaxID=2716227 RepID=UPI00144661C6|nr:hypothetical protein [Gephyromycinifex aptenodytis]